jgi:large subunit ribosomal protein L20
MARVKRGTIKSKHRRYILKAVKGYRFDRKSKERIAKVAIKHAGVHAFRHRRTKKREYRNLWTLRINAAVRDYGFSYSKFMGALKKAEITLDRKSLATLAKDHPESFKRLVESVK